jgi:ribosomal protein S18 acetylase RimI-like enzyme
VTGAEAAFRRALEFELGIEDRCASESARFEWGTLLCYPALPLVWALNFARVEKAPVTLEAEQLVDAVSKLPWPAEVKHRKIVVNDEGLGRRLAPGFETLGWEIERLLFMRLGDGATPAVEQPDVVREIASDEHSEAMVDYLPQVAAKHDPAELHQIIACRKVVERAIEVRHFGAFLDGELASACELFMDGSNAQVENVTTAENRRGRGLSKAVVGTAIAEARNGGADFVFLIAEADDWPKEMYRKMGFEDLGLTYEFHLPGDKAGT